MKLLFFLIFEILRKHMFDTCTARQNGDELLRKERERERDKKRKIDGQTEE
jgi:hypothetical protein